MNEHSGDAGREALARLREIRDVLGQDGAPRRVNLRDYAEPGSPTWDAFVGAVGLPGHKVRRVTMLARINRAIDSLTSRLLGTAPAAQTVPPADTAEPIGRVLAAARELDRLGDDAPHHRRPAERQRLRRLTPAGVELARAFLEQLRARPDGDREPPRELLYDEHYAQQVAGDVEVEPRSFRTRREAAEYLAPRLKPIRYLVGQHPGVWSWLGMFYFAETARAVNGAFDHRQPDERFITDGSIDGRHYLWASWRLSEQHGESAAFLLNQEFADLRHITMRTLTTPRIFNSVGVVALVLRLYTDGQRQKLRFRDARGGFAHLIRVLDQLERTYDVFGMEQDALLRILPDEFRLWDGGTGPSR